MNTAVLVSWLSKKHDPFFRDPAGEQQQGPSLQLLFDSSSPLHGQIRQFYVLAHDRDRAQVLELESAIKDRDGTIEVKPRFMTEDVPPTDHEKVFLFTATTLRDVHHTNARSRIAVNLSPGTPAMHTALLLSLQARLAGETARAFQGIPSEHRKSGEGVAREVSWNLLSQLSSSLPEDTSESRTKEWRLEDAASPQMREVAANVRRVAAVPYPVLLIGARGTGKSHIAWELRERSRDVTVRAPAPWEFHLNCAEFGGGDPNVLKSALFGHEVNAFTGASKRKLGVLERAANDCVFLDEIHHLDPQAQGMLLLALQREGTFRRLGGDDPISAQFRLLAATNVSPAELREKLKPDFLDRISDLVIHLPSLRECKEDLAGIWDSVVVRACRELATLERARHGVAMVGSVDQLVNEFKPHHRAIAHALSDLHLPGNYRDLEKLARRLLASGFANDRLVFSLARAEVDGELQRLRSDERAAELPTTVGNPLIDELPTEATCQAFFRDLRDRGGVIDGNKVIEAWTDRVFGAAIAVSESKAQAARLLSANERTFASRMQKRQHGKS